MELRLFRQLFSLRDVRNAVLGFIVLFGGLGLAGLTYYAHLTSQPRLAGLAAGASLLFVLLSTISCLYFLLHLLSITPLPARLMI